MDARRGAAQCTRGGSQPAHSRGGRQRHGACAVRTDLRGYGAAQWDVLRTLFAAWWWPSLYGQLPALLALPAPPLGPPSVDDEDSVDDDKEADN